MNLGRYYGSHDLLLLQQVLETFNAHVLLMTSSHRLQAGRSG